MYSINLESADFKSHIIQYILQHLAENERISEYPNRIRLFLGLPNLTFGISKTDFFDMRKYLYPNILVSAHLLTK